MIICTHGGFCHLVWETPLQNFKFGYVSSVGRSWFCQMLHQWIVVFSLTLGNHMHNLQEVFGRFKKTEP